MRRKLRRNAKSARFSHFPDSEWTIAGYLETVDKNVKAIPACYNQVIKISRS